MPSIWYDSSQEHVAPGALAGNASDPVVMVREDRLPLPLVWASPHGTGENSTRVVTLQHVRPNGTTTIGDGASGRTEYAHEDLQFGSIGIL